jgi:tetratricopeptide (TPR) repeat protein
VNIGLVCILDCDEHVNKKRDGLKNMTKATIKISSIAPELVFAGRYKEALEHPELPVRWQVLSLLGLNRLDEAEQVIKDAVASGTSETIVYLAAIHRLRGESRAWLLENKLPVTNSFEYCFLEREIAAYYFEQKQFRRAEIHLQHAVHAAEIDENTKQLLPSIAQGYAAIARYLGEEATVLPVLRDALNIAIAGRRTPLLIEIVYVYGLLGKENAMHLAIEELEINPPSFESRDGLILSFLKVRHLHLEGDTRIAYEAFEELHHNVPNWDIDVAFLTALWCALTQLEPGFNRQEDDLEPYAWLAIARDHMEHVPPKLASGWFKAIEAIIEQNPLTAMQAAADFFEAGTQREEAFARALPAVFETNKANGQAPLEYIIRESMTDAMRIAHRIENDASVRLALRFTADSSTLKPYLFQTTPIPAPTPEPLVVEEGRVFVQGIEKRLTRHNAAVQILACFLEAGQHRIPRIRTEKPSEFVGTHTAPPRKRSLRTLSTRTRGWAALPVVYAD